MRSLVRRLDVDGDGAITAGDLRSLLGDSYEGISPEEMLRQSGGPTCDLLIFEDLRALLLHENPAALAAAAVVAGSLPGSHRFPRTLACAARV